MISLHHPSNARLHQVALDRGLRCRPLSPGVYAVSSHSVKGREYKVMVFEASYLCICPASTAGLACSHGARAAAECFPSLVTDWQTDELQRDLKAGLQRIDAALAEARVFALAAIAWERKLRRLDELAAEVFAPVRVAA
jgi:hypothetical protein